MRVPQRVCGEKSTAIDIFGNGQCNFIFGSENMLKLEKNGVNRLKLSYFIVEFVIRFQSILLVLFEFGLVIFEAGDIILELFDFLALLVNLLLLLLV